MEYHLKILHTIVGYLNFRVGLRNIHFDGTLDKQKKQDGFLLEQIHGYCMILPDFATLVEGLARLVFSLEFENHIWRAL
jgi:hypothetical protein